MKGNLSFVESTCSKRMAGHLIAACTSLLLLLALPAVVQAQFAYTTNHGAITIEAYNCSGGSVTIPSTIKGLPVIIIGNYAFSGCTSLTNVTIRKRVTTFGYGSLSYASDNNSIQLGDTTLVRLRQESHLPLESPNSQAIYSDRAFLIRSEQRV